MSIPDPPSADRLSAASKRPSGPGSTFNSSATTPAATYAALRGSKDALPAARAAGEELNKALGGVVDQVTRENALALGRAVRYAAEQGHTLFADLGGGIPIQRSDSWGLPDLYAVASGVQPGLRWLLVDSDELAILYGRALVGRNPDVHVEWEDLRQPAKVLHLLDLHLGVKQKIVCVLGAVLHFMTDRQAATLVSALYEHLVPGSLIFATHVTRTGLPPEMAERGKEVYERLNGVEIHLRTEEEITAMAGPFEIKPPGVVRTIDFMPPQEGPAPEEAPHFLMWMAERLPDETGAQPPAERSV
ncbi:SAM-dependent methyltransferase [Nonomuraea sp. LPB2021202275-12-8]|uniref:SAM-dependent methyltransferase n=1 Tax=Nonomuraea sp. LPB2021202275-12-8 TaxID=3120159 RepID=UPI00300D8B68